MDLSLSPLKRFAITRPVLYGVPTAAALGVILGLAFRVGGQIVEAPPPMAVAPPSAESPAIPIAWPSGRVPDYVIGTDFLASAQPQSPAYRSDAEEFPLLEIPAYSAPLPEPEPVEAAADTLAAPQWASTHGDILDVRLPEDLSPPAEPLQQD